MNHVEINGEAFTARTSPAGTCAGCAGRSLPGEENTPLCRALPSCLAMDREDGRAVVWVREAAK